MGDVNERRGERGLQLLQLDFHVFAQLQVECSEGLVQQQQCRLEDHAARDGDALSLAAGELVGAFATGTAQADPSSIASARRAQLGAPDAPPRASPKATFCATDIIGNSASC